ncbi:uncharacterized protein [Pocillopora verrucosa]|nr:uncharacterized protein LOC113665891 [Pocillopora damicornis]XP_027037423.1 uncharacterized protein LOC113665891 [Pocillopora damicornis]XP_058960935.1 uncharacterized protein LOC131787875 [Pocillopora verrucosa]XP_058960936.1 uncharacterized protein LOC131787875 [Pocillopora verrucosa]
MTNNNVVTLSWLLAQDLPQAYIFTERPSTFNHNATFVNDKKYVIHDYLPNITEDNRHLKAMRACPVAGSKFPILVTRDINPLIREHWSKWLPFFPKPDIRIFDKEDTGDRPLIVNFPFQSFPANKHAVNPDVHYKLSSKARIPEMGAPCPRHMSRDNYTLPCIIKAAQGKGKRGTFLVKTEEEVTEALNELSNNFCDAELVVTEVIENVSKCLLAQLYIFQNGLFHWLGVKCKSNLPFVKRPEGYIPTPDVNWDEQEELEEMLRDVVHPVTQYLHGNGYFGFTGVEILVNDKGCFVVDVNLKIASSTNLLLIAPHMAALNFPISYVMEILPTNIKHLLEAIDSLNHQGDGRAILLADGELSVEIQHKACVVIFAKNCEDVFKFQRELLKVAGNEISSGTSLGP